MDRTFRPSPSYFHEPRDLFDLSAQRQMCLYVVIVKIRRNAPFDLTSFKQCLSILINTNVMPSKEIIFFYNYTTETEKMLSTHSSGKIEKKRKYSKRNYERG